MDEAHPRVRVVYIEDEAFFGGTMARLLEEAGYHAVVAADGQEGVTVVTREHPDLVLMDLVLPKLDGREVLERLKTNPATKDIPVFVLSNLSSDTDKQELTSLGAEQYYVKAMTLPSDVVAAVKQRLG